MTFDFLLNNISLSLDPNFFEFITNKIFYKIYETKTMPVFSKIYPSTTGYIQFDEKQAIPRKIDSPEHDNITNHSRLLGVKNLTIYNEYYIPNIHEEITLYSIKQWKSSNSGFEKFVKISLISGENLVKFGGAFLRAPFVFYVDFYKNIEITEIPSGLEEMFITLYRYDIEIYLYHRYSYLDKNNNYEGKNIEMDISKYGESESKRSELLEIMRQDGMVKRARESYSYFY